ncbi:MAG: carboxymuconolactone decarboxylase family protein [Methylococcaceae bacterium]|nr:carboxymuconolactone decarboxylase family protein [Methylococcaceae bacterium]
MRLDYCSIAPQPVKMLAQVNDYLAHGVLDPKLADLLFLRVSQINGCSYCVRLHAQDLRRAGELDARLDTLAAWRESPFFTEREKAALAWTESLTHIASTHAPDEVFAALSTHFNDPEIVDLTHAVALINAWNRIAIGFRHAPDS